MAIFQNLSVHILPTVAVRKIGVRRLHRDEAMRYNHSRRSGRGANKYGALGNTIVSPTSPDCPSEMLTYEYCLLTLRQYDFSEVSGNPSNP